MTVWGAFYQIVIGPLRLLLEMVYEAAYLLLGSAGGAILPLSLAVNLLLLPFYRRADALQRAERALEKQMAPGLAHIKKTFRGDERYMMQRAYYRIHGYKPVYALRSALPLLLQIPFFIAAYGFLSGLKMLEGAAFGPIADLSRPDSLLSLGGVTVNLLPILMTAINIASCEVYTRDLARKDKLQLYAMALVFLALLYGSPSGLVLYWTLNNLFSLVKNLVQVLAAKRPERAQKEEAAGTQDAPRSRGFLWSCVFLTILTGVLIPSAVIRSSPAEFVLVADLHSPLRYVLNSLLTAAGAFLLWGSLFYALAGRRGRRAVEAVLWIVSVTAAMNYMCFGTKLGMISPQLQFDNGLSFSVRELTVNAEAVLLLGTAALVLWMKRRRAIVFILPVLAAAALGMSVYNTVRIQAEMPAIRQAVESDTAEQAQITLSRDGENVIVIMLDRSFGGFIPYLFQEKPELAQRYDGFTWYPNTISYGPATNTGSPAVFGGYEYTPEAMNARPDELLADKHNESLLLMPRLFSEAGWATTVCDPTYAGYSWIPDLTVFNDYPDIHTFLLENKSFDSQMAELDALQEPIWQRDFFCYSLMKASPLLLQPIIYQHGFYLDPTRSESDLMQVRDGVFRATGVSRRFLHSYNALCALPELTQLTDAPGAFLLLCNSTIHNAMLLSEPDYVPAETVDNMEYDAAHTDRFIWEGRRIRVQTELQMIAYQSTMAALLKLGEWFDSLRDAGVYDRTRIIIVADHGYGLGYFDDMLLHTDGPIKDLTQYNPLLLVKDFDSHGFTVDERFMTNADTPALATADVLADPVNPFTGKAIDSAAKAGEQHIFYTTVWQTDVNNGTTFLPGAWYAVSPDKAAFDPDNWKLIGEY